MIPHLHILDVQRIVYVTLINGIFFLSRAYSLPTLSYLINFYIFSKSFFMLLSFLHDWT